MVTEEFSFPMISHNKANLTDTPSLWRISSQLHSDFDKNDSGFGRRRKVFRKSFCDMGETWREMDDMIEFHSSDEKMDFLWENFNDVEEGFASKLSSPESYEYGGRNVTEDDEICSVQSLKVPKTTSSIGVVSAKKHKVVLVLKVFQKLMLLHNISRLKKIGT